MKKRIPCIMKHSMRFLAVPLLLLSAYYASAATPFDPSKYTEVEATSLKATPEDYKNKKITYVSKYRNYTTSFPQYMDKSGFKQGKHYLLNIYPSMLPAIAKKGDEINDLVADKLLPGKKVKIYGKVEKFRIAPEKTRLPNYYLEVDNIEILEGDIDFKDDDIDMKDDDKAVAPEDGKVKMKLKGFPGRQNNPGKD